MLLRLAALLILACTPIRAEVPRVVADIAPVRSLAAQVMGDLGSPDLLLRPGASPHGYALRPTEARDLQEATLVFWVGPALTPWLADPLETLAGEATRVALIEATGTQLLEVREGPVFGDGDAADHDRGHADHDHAGPDPHAWLDPENARAWLAAMAEALAAADPENAATYRANAAAAAKAIAAQAKAIAARLAPLADRPFVVYHDAFQYFETRFGLAPLGAIAFGDAAAPGPARLAALRDRLAGAGALCIFSEPLYNEGLIRAISPDGARHAVLDPLGADLPPGPGLYAALLDDIAKTIAACLNG